MKADIKTKKKQHWFNTQSMDFLQDVFQITALVLVSEMNQYHLNGLNLFLETVYERLGSLTLVWQPTLEKKNSEFMIDLLFLKINFVSHPDLSEGN